jgi:RimJ/RimL family protein N-acetyltransferase
MTSPVARHWPLFSLRVRTERLELRLPSDEDLAALADVAASGIHPFNEMPFLRPWTRDASPARERNMLKFHWGCRANWSAESWAANFAVIQDGEVIGSQGIVATEFAVTRTVSSGSWLGQAFQGRGIGTEMRAAVLHFAFEGLGAIEVVSSAFIENPASAAVSRKLGYELDGTEVHAVEGLRRIAQRFRLTRERWEATERIPVTIEGLEPCLDLFGAA